MTEQHSIESFQSEQRSLRGTGSELAKLLSKQLVPGSPSSQGANLGEVPWPFSRQGCMAWYHLNEYHASCIETAVACTIGLGFVSENEKTRRREKAAAEKAAMTGQMVPPGEAEESSGSERSKAAQVLDPLCDGSFQETLTDVMNDIANTGNGALEIVRQVRGDQSSPVAAIYHVPIQTIGKWIDNTDGSYHYVVHPQESVVGLADVHFNVFGSRFSRPGSAQERSISNGFEMDPEAGEIIFFRRPSSFSRHYGYPGWLCSVPSVELYSSLTQHLFDFFNNRGVPEMMLLFLGRQLPKELWAQIKDALKQHRGPGNGFKSIALNLQDPDLKVQVEKLAAEVGPEGMFTDLSDALAARIVSAHGVPPLLAGIMVPGKLGATNELPNSLKAYQLLRVGPLQRVIMDRLATTLGDSTKSGLDLVPEDFELNTIDKAIDLNSMDTVARMRQPLAQGGRDPKEGLKS